MARGNQKLPQFLRPIFWDYRFSSLRWHTDKDLIIARVLAHGTLPAIRWLRRRLGDDALREWLVRRRGGGLRPQQLRFWELIVKIPRREVTAWLRDPERQIWDQRTRR